MKTRRILLYICLLTSVLTWAQNRQKRRLRKVIDNAIELIDLNDFYVAFSNLSEYYEQDSTNRRLNYYLGYSAFYAFKDKTKSRPFLEQSKGYRALAYLLLAKVYHKDEQLNLALNYIDKFKEKYNKPEGKWTKEVTQLHKQIEVAKQLNANRLTSVEVENMGANMNSEYPDYAPVLFDKGRKMMITSRRKGVHPKIKDPNNEYFEDIYVCFYQKGKWTKPLNLGEPVNSKTHDAALAVLNNGKRLIMYRTSSNLIGGDVYYSDFRKINWLEPQTFDININTKKGNESSICFYPDGKRVIFASSRKGGKGGKDLYFVEQLDNGKWTQPTSLGDLINTEYDEDGPFVSPDGKTLYFSSRGHENMGGYDLFVSQWSDENKTWGEPKNMGVPMNSVNDDIFITSLNNIDFYFSSNRKEGYGLSDIYKAIIYPEGTVLIPFEGQILLPQTEPKPKTYKTSIEIFNTDSLLLKHIDLPKTESNFSLELPKGIDYLIEIKKKGFQTYKTKIKLPEEKGLYKKQFNLEILN